MAKVKLPKGWSRKWLGTPTVLAERNWQEVRLVAHSDANERRHVWAYTDRDGWHGYYMPHDREEGEEPMISWHYCHWKEECVTSHTEKEGCV